MFVAHMFLGPLLYESKTTDSSDTSIQVEVYEYKNDDPKFNEIIYNPQGVMFTTLMSWSRGLALPSSWRSICEKAL